MGLFRCVVVAVAGDVSVAVFDGGTIAMAKITSLIVPRGKPARRNPIFPKLGVNAVRPYIRPPASLVNQPLVGENGFVVHLKTNPAGIGELS